MVQNVQADVGEWDVSEDSCVFTKRYIATITEQKLKKNGGCNMSKITKERKVTYYIGIGMMVIGFQLLV
jgi:hypothetical protein